MSKNGVVGTSVVASHSNNQSYIIGNDQKRNSIRANFDIRPSKKVTASLSTSLARNEINRDGTGDFWSGWAATQAFFLPIFPEKGKNGDWFAYTINPKAQREHNKLRNLEWRSLNSLNIKWDITESLSFNGLL